jgi:hypothetical protein
MQLLSDYNVILFLCIQLSFSDFDFAEIVVVMLIFAGYRRIMNIYN